MSRPQHWGWWLATLGALAVVLWSMTWLWAEWSAWRARGWTETWAHQAALAQKKGEDYAPDPAQWARVRVLAERAVWLAPVNADYQELLGSVHELRYPLAFIGDAQAQPSRELAVQYYREVTRRRPTWPFAWMRLAYALAMSDAPLPELEAALAEAARRGPWEPQVMFAIVDIGLDGWFRLSPEGRAVVLDTLRRSQSWAAGRRGQQHADAVWERVLAHRKQMLACSLLPMNTERNRRICHPDNW